MTSFQVTCRAPSLMVTLGPARRMVACPLVMVMPVSLMAMEAPDEDLRRMPPLAPGASLIIRMFPPTDCRTMVWTPGGEAVAKGGTSAALPQKQPDQTG